MADRDYRADVAWAMEAWAAFPPESHARVLLLDFAKICGVMEWLENSNGTLRADISSLQAQLEALLDKLR